MGFLAPVHNRTGTEMHSSPESISTTSTYIEIRRRRTHTPASRLYTCRRAYVHVLYQFDLI